MDEIKKKTNSVEEIDRQSTGGVNNYFDIFFLLSNLGRIGR